MFALVVAGVVLVGSIAPAAAGQSGAQGVRHRAAPAALTPLPPVVRDHRPKPVVRDHINGTVTRDHRGGSTVAAKHRRSRKPPCLGNLCNVKVCAASVCF